MRTLPISRSFPYGVPGIAVIFWLFPSLSYTQFQIVHDAPNTTTSPVLQPLILADGSIATYHWKDGEHIFRRYSELGEHLWSRSFSVGQQMGYWENGILAWERDDAAGFRAICYAGKSSTPTDPENYWGEHLVEERFQFLHMNANGDAEVSREWTRSYVLSDGNGPSSPLPDLIDLARSPDGGLVSAITKRRAGGESIAIVKITADGMVEWSRSVGHYVQTAPPNTIPEPTWGYDSHLRGSVAAAPDGSIYCSESGNFHLTHLRLAKLAPNGDLLWMKRFVYGNNIISIQYHDIAVDGNGAIHAGGHLQTTVGKFHIFMRISSDGSLERADLYRTDNIPFMHDRFNKEFHLDDQGRRYHRGVDGILQADTLGSAATFLRRDDQVVLPNNVFIPIKGVDVHDGRMAMSGLLHHEHVDLAFTTRYEGLFSYDTDNLYSCFMSDTTFAHIEVPLSIVSIEDVTTAVSLDVSSFYSSQPNTLALNSIPLEPLDTLCSFAYNLLGMEVGMEEEPGLVRLPLIQQTLLPRDGMILLNDVGAASVDIWSSNGALVQRLNLNNSTGHIPAAGWPAGIYLIRALDIMGDPIRSQRLMIE